MKIEQTWLFKKYYKKSYILTDIHIENIYQVCRMLKSHSGSTMVKFYLLGLMAVSVLSEDNGEDYIIEGTNAKKNEFPWQGEISIKIISY